MKACVIIPARYKSKRFPGKPLVKILNKEMIIWVAELSSKAVGKENVFIATDDSRISKVASDYNFKFIMTNSDLLTGTDRVASASKELNYDIFVNVQGDEPIVNPSDILRSIEYKKKFTDSIINSYCYLKDDEDPLDKNIPKVITNHNDDLIYISRAVIPNHKQDFTERIIYKKQVCIYSYSKKELHKFLSYGKKSYLEKIEDIEILRFFEFDTKIKMFETLHSSQAVDVISDVAKVELILKVDPTI